MSWTAWLARVAAPIAMSLMMLSSAACVSALPLVVSPSDTVLELDPPAEATGLTVSLPPTDGTIMVEFDEDLFTTTSFRATAPDGPAFEIERCISGCPVEFEYVGQAAATVVTIEYLAGDTEYIDDIEVTFKQS